MPPNIEERAMQTPAHHQPYPRQHGQAILEYMLLLSLVGVVLIGGLTLTGIVIRSVFEDQITLLDRTAREAHYRSGEDARSPDPPIATPRDRPPESGGDGPSPPLASDPGVPAPPDVRNPGTSPDPSDHAPVIYGYPFHDSGHHTSTWQTDLGDVLRNSWTVEYWNYSDYGIQPDMRTMPDGSGVYSEQRAQIAFDLGADESPAPEVERDFYARFTSTVELGDMAYILRIRKDDGVRVWIGDQIVVDANVPESGDAATWTREPLGGAWFERAYTAAAGTHTITVEFVDYGGAAHLALELHEAQQRTSGDCNWSLNSEQFFSPYAAWTDSPDSLTSAGSYCILALNGTVDLRGAANPQLEFYDQHDLHGSIIALVSIAPHDTDDWVDLPLHTGGADPTWKRQVFDLANFNDVDFRDSVIRLRFILDARDTTATGDGWWLDDISISDTTTRRYTVGFADDMEGTSHWVPEGAWARSNEVARSSVLAWSDSPGNLSPSGTNSTLELGGIVDLSDPAVIAPELVFWQRYDLLSGDAAFVEISLDARRTWQPLTGGALVQGRTNWAWHHVVLPLDELAGQTFHLRFRLDARSGASSDGWWIDDVVLRNAPTTAITPRWCDSMERDGGHWITEGDWTLITGADPNPDHPTGHAPAAYHGARFWSDSPGKRYTLQTASALMLASWIDLSATEQPELVFQHRYDLGDHDRLAVQVQTATGTAWETIWRYRAGALPQGYGCAGCVIADAGYDHNLTWTRETVDLAAYAGMRVRLRFLLDAGDDPATGDGWWLDHICIQPHSARRLAVGFREDFESGFNGWYPAEWASTSAHVHGGTQSAQDSADDYHPYTNNILQLRGDIDLSGSVQPMLTYWQTFDLAEDAYALVELDISDDGGSTWQGWREIVQHTNTTILSWHYHQIDLTPYRPTATYPDRVIRLRFRLYAPTAAQTADGWWIDDIALLDRHAHTRTFSLPFFDDAETPNDHWLFEGTWGRESEPEYPGSAQELMGTVYHDSPNPNDPESKTLYAHLSNMALRLDGEIDLSGTAPAVLTYWDKRDLGAGDRAYVELSTDGGFTWTAIHMEHRDATAWQAHSLDLSRYAALPAPHNRIVIRFRLDARSDTATGDGWYIDAIRVDG